VAYDVRFSANPPEADKNLSPAGGLRLPAGKHKSILIYYQTVVKEKIKKFTTESAEFYGLTFGRFNGWKEKQQIKNC
jgi:hypothetical protein